MSEPESAVEPESVVETELVIETMRKRDLRRVMEVENVAHQAPWTFTLFLQQLNLREGRHFFVIRQGDDIVGHCGMMFVADEAHIATIAVKPDLQGRALGTRMMLHAHRWSITHRYRHMTLEVRVSNQAGLRLYERFGYRCEGIRKKYYTDNKEDAAIMWVRDINSDKHLARLEEIEASLIPATVDLVDS